MITLYGMSLSNYYNKVKLVLLEKGLPFREELVKTFSGAPEVLEASPLAKIPFIRLEDGRPLCESEVICEYLEQIQPEPRLLPVDAFEAAKVRELVTFVELHLELVGRELYGQAFFGGSCSESNQQRVRKVLTKNIAAFKQLAKFSPYIAGSSYSLADCAAWASLPVVGMATKAVLGEDLLQAAGIDWKTYARFIAERPAVQKVVADRKADQERAAAAKSG
ncbi:glutathione S-transferase [Pelomonas sp. SE-A7]|uniref:glutathione S-transferase family protein n=1 Tax=Pelomonas sp. SE-A7 TaxID=3054953 RepID=UPI00259C6C62|nr:glutathione S-transferase [Pelomonas sp. SE-A7]MDM4766944.1 glutathione S-transferase [Pelomonas sp. SE-A7]